LEFNVPLSFAAQTWLYQRRGS